MFTGFIVWKFGDFREWRLYLGLLAYWCLVWLAIERVPLFNQVVLHTLIAALFFVPLMRRSEVKIGGYYPGYFMGGLFALLFIAGFLAIGGVLSIAPGQGIQGATYWNVLAVVMHVVLITLMLTTIIRYRERGSARHQPGSDQDRRGDRR